MPKGFYIDPDLKFDINKMQSALKEVDSRVARQSPLGERDINAISVPRICLKRRIAVVCGNTVMTMSVALCAETAAGLNARQNIAKPVKRAEILIVPKPQKEVIVHRP